MCLYPQNLFSFSTFVSHCRFVCPRWKIHLGKFSFSFFLSFFFLSEARIFAFTVGWAVHATLRGKPLNKVRRQQAAICPGSAPVLASMFARSGDASTSPHVCTDWQKSPSPLSHARARRQAAFRLSNSHLCAHR